MKIRCFYLLPKLLRSILLKNTSEMGGRNEVLSFRKERLIKAKYLFLNTESSLKICLWRFLCCILTFLPWYFKVLQSLLN